MPPRLILRPLGLAIALLYSASALSTTHASPTRLTIYRDTGDALYSASADGTIDSGYAVVNESRSLNLQSGRQSLQIDQLPPLLDPQTLSLQAPAGQWSLRSSQLLPPAARPEQALQGRQVQVLGDAGQVLAQGQLLASPSGLVVQDVQGQSVWIQHYAAIRSQTPPPSGAILHLDLDARQSGAAPLALGYATRGLGWRGIYQAVLTQGERCSLRLDAQASIGNHSGRDWRHVRIDLIAGSPNFDEGNVARPLMVRAMAMPMAKSADGLPQQSALDAYQRYRLPVAFDLPDQSVTQLPLYPTQTIACQRTTQVDLGGGAGYGRNHPDVSVLPLNETPSAQTRLSFTAPVNLPAGTIYVKTADSDGVLQWLGNSRLQDTAAQQAVELTLGQSFLLTAHQLRLSSHLDRAHRQFDETFQVSIDNAGDTGTQIEVLAHPQRWSQWQVVDTDAKVIRDGSNQFRVRLNVPAHGHTQWRYTVRYQWQPGDLPAPAQTE